MQQLTGDPNPYCECRDTSRLVKLSDELIMALTVLAAGAATETHERFPAFEMKGYLQENL